MGMASYGGEIQLFSEANANQISRPGVLDEEVSLGKTINTYKLLRIHPDYTEPCTIGRRTTVDDGEVTFS